MTSTQGPEDEVARLRAEVARLRAAGAPEPDPAGGRGWWRPLVAGILVAIVALLAPISVLATWARDEIEDTDRYVETITPLASDPAVQEAIATRIEEVVFSHLDLDAVSQDVTNAISSARDLPPRVVITLQAVSGPLASAIQNFISDRIEAFVRSDLFETAWIEANRAAHTQMVAVLTGEGGGTVDVSGGTVQVNLTDLIDAVKQKLIDDGFGLASRIPEVQDTFTIVRSEELADAQWLFDVLDEVATWLPVIGLLLLAVAVFIARDRRRMILAGGLAIAGAMLLLGTVLNLARPLYLDAIPADASTDAAAAVYDTLVGFIRLALRAVAVVALTVAVVAWLSAPSGAGAAVRRGLGRGLDALRTGRARAGLRTGRLGEALGQYRTAVRVAIVGCAAVLYLLQDHPTGATALSFVIITALLLAVVEVLASPTSPRKEVAVARHGADDGGG